MIVSDLVEWVAPYIGVMACFNGAVPVDCGTVFALMLRTRSLGDGNGVRLTQSADGSQSLPKNFAPNACLSAAFFSFFASRRAAASSANALTCCFSVAFDRRASIGLR